MLDVHPEQILLGDTPRLIDEWQEQPLIWNTVRHEVDDRKKKGQFILTGSSAPADRKGLHSGVGRFGIITLRTMTQSEIGNTEREISFRDIFKRKKLSSKNYEPDLKTLAKNIAVGGWPGNLGLKYNKALLNNINYLNVLCENDIEMTIGRRMDGAKLRRLIRSIARNVSTESSNAIMAKDIDGKNEDLSKKRGYQLLKRP
jgi:predicted AAA+ superfamily ATPase